MKEKELRERVLHEMGAFLSQTKHAFVERFSIYDNVSFFEYKVSDSECVTIGFHKRNGEINVLLLRSTIAAIRENIALVLRGHKKNTINALVCTIDCSEERWFKIHSERGHFIDGSLLAGNFARVFYLVVKQVHALYKQESHLLN